MDNNTSASPPLGDVGNTTPHIPPIRLPVGGGGKQQAVAPLRAAAAVLDGDSGANAKGSAETAEDKLTPRILEALALLDAETAALGALSPRAHDAATNAQASADAADDEMPEWLMTAANEVEGDDGAGERFAERQNVEEEEVVAVTMPVMDAGRGGASSSSSSSSSDAAALPVALATLGHELRQSEEHCRHLRTMAYTQAGTAQEVATQLELTKSAAEATASAARRIVDDHQADIALLLAELRKLSPEAAGRVEPRLSAPLAALAARKRHAQAASAMRRKQNAAAAQRSGSPRPGGERGAGGPAGGATSTRGRGVAAAPARAESPLMERVERLGAAAADLAEKVVRRAGSPWRGRPGRDE
jgi:hypothetical protein